MFVNFLNRELSLLGKRTWMEWETMVTRDLVNLNHQFPCPLDKQFISKVAKIFNLVLSLGKLKVLYKTERLQILAIIAE